MLAYAVARAPVTSGVSAALGAIGGALLLLVLARGTADALPLALGLLGAAYAVSLFPHGGPLDARTPLVAAVLLLCAELAAWSLDERRRIPGEPRVAALRAVGVALLVLGGLGAAALAVALASAPAGVGVGWTAIGAAAAVAVVALAAGLLRRRAA